MKENGESNSEVKYLRDMIYPIAESYGKERLMIECRKYKIPSAYALEIIKYIYPDIRQTSYCPVLVIKWLNDEYLIDEQLKSKNLAKIPVEERKKYLKYRVGREIKVRYRFKDKSRKYQDTKLMQLYCLKLYNYLKRNGY